MKKQELTEREFKAQKLEEDSLSLIDLRMSTFPEFRSHEEMLWVNQPLRIQMKLNI